MPIHDIYTFTHTHTIADGHSLLAPLRRRLDHLFATFRTSIALTLGAFLPLLLAILVSLSSFWDICGKLYSSNALRRPAKNARKTNAMW